MIIQLYLKAGFVATDRQTEKIEIFKSLAYCVQQSCKQHQVTDPDNDAPQFLLMLCFAPVMCHTFHCSLWGL